MHLKLAIEKSFTQLSGSLEQIHESQYTKPCLNLGHATIGQHVRHIIEMFQCLEKGYTSGTVNYELRPRDKKIETDKSCALQLLDEIFQQLDKPDKPLILEGVYSDEHSTLMQFNTNYYREVVYNLEHTIHHMALIRVGLTELTNLELPQGYGVASATVKYKNTCVQ